MKGKVFPKIDKINQLKFAFELEQGKNSQTTKAAEISKVPAFFQANTVEETFEKLNSKLDTHQDKIQDQSSVIQNLLSNFQVLKDHIIKEKNENQQKIEIINNLNFEICDLKENLKKQLKNAKDISTIQDENQKLKQNNDQLSKKIQEEIELNKQCSNKIKELEKLIESQNKVQIEKPIKKSDDVENKKLLQQIDENKKLLQQINEIKQREQELQQKIKSVEDKLDNCIKQDKQQNEKITSLLKTNSELTDQKKTQITEIENLKSQLKQQQNNQVNASALELLQKENQKFQQQIKDLNSSSKGYISINLELSQQIKILQESFEKLKKKDQESALREQQLQDKIKLIQDESKDKLEQMHKNIIEMLEQCKKENQAKVSTLQEKITCYENELLQHKNSNSQNMKKIEQQIKQLSDADKEISKQVNCTYCSKPLDEPVTIIPCGHSFCLKCKIGYDKGSCVKCGPKVKIDSIYRNELMDDILNLLKLVRNSRQLLEDKLAGGLNKKEAVIAVKK